MPSGPTRLCAVARDQVRTGWVPRAKLRLPGLPDDVVLDPALVAGALDTVRSHPLTLVVAAPGAGKTTLAAAVAHAVGADAVGWVRLDEHDDDPNQLLALLVAATGAWGGSAPSPVEPLLAQGATTPVDARRTAAVLLDALDQGPRSDDGRDLVVVLDDLHVLSGGEGLDLLGYVVEHLPEHVHLLATSRTQPALGLARLRSRHQLGELGDHDLALDATQAAVLLNEHLGLGLDGAEVDELVSASSGWVTGVRLLGRSPEAVDEYLDDELLARADPGVARFLTDLAVLDTVTPATATTLTGREDAGTLLAELVRDHGLFVQVVDRDEPEYRLHDLLRSHLLRRLRTHDHLRLALLHRTAAETASSPAGRIEHLLAAEAWDDAADAIDAAIDLFAGPATMQRIVGWLARLPPTQRDRPRFRLVDGLAAARRGDLHRAVDQLEPLLVDLEADGDDGARWLAVRALHVSTYDHQRWVPLLAAAEQLRSFDALPPSARADHHLSSAYGALFTGRWDEVARRVDAAIAASVDTGDVGAAETVAQHLSPLLAGAPGVVDQVATYASWAEDHLAGSPMVDAGVVHQRAWTTLLRGDPLAAADVVRAAPQLLALIRTFPFLRITIDWVLTTAALVEDDARTAEHLLVEAIDRVDANALDHQLDELRSCSLARLLRARGDVAGLRDLDARLGLTDRSDTPDASTAVRPSVSAQRCWAEGDLHRAEAHLREAAAIERTERVRTCVVNPSLDLALLLDQRGRPDEALAVLDDAVARFAAWGTPGLLLAAGPELAPLLRRLPPGPTVAAARTALDGDEVPAALAVPGSPAVLTGREVQVLRLLERGASNQAIADTLVISPNTAKSHVRNVLAKLGAGSRGEAVAIARDHHLV